MNKKGSNPEESTEEFNNDQVRVIVKKQPHCQVTMEIAVTPKATAAAYKYAIKSINKEVSVPGFRKGRAPEPMIEKNYKKYVDQEWKEVLVQTAFQEAMAVTKLYPMNKEAIKKPQLKSASREEGASIEIAFETSPKLPDIDPKELVLKQVKRKEVTEAEIEATVGNIRLQCAKWEEVADRPVQEGDYIDITVEEVENPGNFLCENTRFIVEKGKMGEWMRQLVTGKNVNDTVEGMSQRPDNHDPDEDFIPIRCKISILSIKSALMPALDNELAKKVGVNSVEELKSRVNANLNHQADEEVQEKLRNQLETLLLDKYSFDLPASLIQKEVGDRLHNIKTRLHQSGTPAEEIAKTAVELEQTIKEEVQHSFCLFFIASKIAEENNITVTQNELAKEVLTYMYMGKTSEESSLTSEDARNKAYLRLLTQKVEDHLIERATIEL
ncbi:MAG: trigger factor [Waddliaceae bacterium]